MKTTNKCMDTMKRYSKQELAANDRKALAEIILLIFVICILT